MVTAESVKSKLQGLIDQANAVTGGADADLTTALGRLIAGFGQGGGLVVGATNLHDSSTDIADTYLADGSGTETKYSGWNCTDYIPVEAGKIYNVVCLQISVQYCFLYNENKEVHKHTYFGGLNRSMSATGNDVFFFFIAPINGYVRFSGDASRIKSLELHECAGSIDIASETYTDAVVYSDDIPAEVALDILTGGGPEE